MLVRGSEATHVVFDDDLTPSQQANLEDCDAGGAACSIARLSSSRSSASTR